MQWAKISQDMVRAPEYIGSNPSERAAWLNVLMHCAGLENGGRVVGAKQWKDRQWQQTCGVTAKEVESATKLLTWEGDDLIVWKYPKDNENDVKAKREGGRRGGLKRASNASRLASNSASSIAADTASTDKMI